MMMSQQQCRLRTRGRTSSRYGWWYIYPSHITRSTRPHILPSYLYHVCIRITPRPPPTHTQVYWAYIVGMLKSLGKMNIDKIHSTLRMFAMQGDGSQECSQVTTITAMYTSSCI